MQKDDYFYISLIFAIIFGATGVFAYAPFHLWIFSFFSFSGLLALIHQKTAKRTALIALFWGIGYFLSGVYWVYISIKQYGELPEFMAILTLLLFILYLSFYPILFSLLLRKLKKIAPYYSFRQFVIVAPMMWQFTEWIRGTFLNGFSWLQFGYAQLDSPLKGFFPILGINGVNFIFSICCGLFLFAFFSLYNSFNNLNINRNYFVYIPLFIIFTIFGLGLKLQEIQWTEPDLSRQANVVLLQGNIKQSLRWSAKQLDNTLNIYRDLTEKNITGSQIIIWPEAAITDIESHQQYYLTNLDRYAKEHNSSIAVGILDLIKENRENKIYNSLIVLGGKDPYEYPTKNHYLKHHLVPFGEYTPLESILKPIAELLNIPMSNLSAGDSIQSPLIMKGFKFTTAICYEIILSDFVRNNFNEKTDFLLTVSNDAWFGKSIAPFQHLQMASARALELGRTLLRSTNDGITAIVSPEGNIIKQISQFKESSLSITLNPSIGLTPYAKWGNTILIAWFLFFSFLLIFLNKKRN